MESTLNRMCVNPLQDKVNDIRAAAKEVLDDLEADFVDVTAWRKLGETVAQYFSKGRMAVVEGRLQIRSFVSLMAEDGFQNADVVFLTDGECELRGEYMEELRARQAELGFELTGILLDTGTPGMAFSLERFCQTIYRTSELMGDEIVQQVVNQRVR